MMPKQEEKKKERIKALLHDDVIVAENSQQAQELYNLSRFGILKDNKRLHLSLIEGLYLVEKEKLAVYDKRNHLIDEDTLVKKSTRQQKNFIIRYNVFRDLRDRGYIVKTALKFGADFRVYDRGIKPGEDHAKWVVYPVHESAAMTWYEFAAKNRVAHSTKKRLLLGIVDDEDDVSYWECKWIRP
jgi:tRNA-intron endonuclease, archaea type